MKGLGAQLRENRTVLGLFAITAVLFVWPVVMVGIGAFREGGSEGGFTWGGFTDAYTDGKTFTALMNSVVFALVVSVLSTALAILLAWMVARTDIPLKSAITPMMILLLAMPTILYAISWDLFGSQNGGLANHLLHQTGLTNGNPVNVESWTGLICISAIKLTPFAYLLILGPFLTLDTTIEEASFVAGAGRFATFVRIDLAALAPSIVGALLLTVVLGIEAFDLPLILGTPAHIEVFSTQIYSYIQDYTPSRYPQAGALSIFLMILVSALVIGRWRVLGTREYTTFSGKSYRPGTWHLGPARWFGTVLIIGIAVLTFLLPMAQLVIGSMQPIFGIYGTYTLDNYRTVLHDSRTIDSMKITAIVAIVGGFVTMCLACAIGYAIARRRNHLSRALGWTTWIPWALPGVVLGLGILWGYLSVPGVSKLYGTTWLLMIGLGTVAIPAAARAAEGALAQVPPDLVAAARMNGSGPLGAFLRIVAPLIAPSFLAGWVLSAIIIAGNLSVAILISSPATSTIPVIAYSLYNGGQTSVAAALFCLVLAAMLITYCALIILRSLPGQAASLRRRRAKKATASEPGMSTHRSSAWARPGRQ